MLGLLTSSAVVNSLASSQSAMGAQSKTYSQRIANLPCRLARKQFREVNEFGKLTILSGWRLYCEFNSTNSAIAISDRIVVESKTFEVKGIYNAGYMDHHIEIDLLEID